MHSPAPRFSSDYPLSASGARVVPIRGDVGDGTSPSHVGDGVAGALARRINVICTTAFDAMLVVDGERRFRRLNGPGADLLGASRATILRSRIDDFTPDQNLQEMEGMWTSLNRDGRLAGSYEVLRGDGRVTRVEFRARTEFDDGEHLIVARPVRDLAAGQFGPDAECPLTRREREVLQLAADGRAVRDIADELFVSVGTIKTHFQHIHSKLGVTNRAAAVASALRLGLIE